MIKELIASFRAIVAFTLLTGIVYPLAITGVAQIAFSKQANGSLVYSGGRLAGSSLLAQKFTGPRYFHPRPSAADYATVASGASNQGFTSAKLRDFVTAQRGIWGENAPSDLLYASGSGLDPHISPEAAKWQAESVAKARGIDPAKVAALVTQYTENPQLDFLGEPRVNVLLLNQALDALH